MLRNGNGTLNGILQLGCAQFDALRATINRQLRQHHYQHGIRHVASHCAGCHLVRNSAHCHGVVTINTAVLIRHYKRAAGSARLITYCAAFEPLLQNGLTTFKSTQIVGRCQRLRSSTLMIKAGRCWC